MTFADDVLGDWDDAMDRFFTAVQRKADAAGLKSEVVRDELVRGYGHEVADAWDEWSTE